MTIQSTKAGTKGLTRGKVNVTENIPNRYKIALSNEVSMLINNKKVTLLYKH